MLVGELRQRRVAARNPTNRVVLDRRGRAPRDEFLGGNEKTKMKAAMGRSLNPDFPAKPPSVEVHDRALVHKRNQEIDRPW